METLIINIPEKQSPLVKQLLKALGVTIQSASDSKQSDYKQKLLQVSTWTDEEIKLIEESKAFDNLKPEQW